MIMCYDRNKKDEFIDESNLDFKDLRKPAIIQILIKFSQLNHSWTNLFMNKIFYKKKHWNFLFF